MIKKFLNVFMCIGLLMQNFLFVIPVMAEETQKEEFIINSITQNGKELEVVDGVYQVDGLEQIIVNYTIKNPITTKTYDVETLHSTGGGSGSFSGLTSDYTSDDYGVKLDINNEISEITYNLYGGEEENKELIGTHKLKFKFTQFNEYNLANSNLYITEIKQGGNVIKENEENYNRYEFNKIQDITISLKGENFIDDKIYPLYTDSFNSVEYTGKELNDGIVIDIPIKDKSWVSISAEIRFEAFNNYIGAKPLSCKDSDWCYLQYEFKDNENISDYDIGLSYTNYKDKKVKSINEFNEYYHNMYIVSSKYHNENNSLKVNINGKNYLDKDYNVKINVIRNDETLYTKDVNVNGLLLNGGYSIELDNFVSSKAKTYDEEKDKYVVETIIDYTTTQTDYMYGYSENYSTIESEIFFENGKKNLSTFRGDGSYYFNSGFADTNKDAFAKYNNIYLRYVGKYFENNLTYDYELSYGYSDNMGGLEKVEVLKTGSINGKLLNTAGLMFAVNNKNNYRYPTYRLEIKYNDEIIYYSSPVLDLVDTPTLANVSLTNGNNKDLYLRMDDYTYVATRNFPITLAISGIGFEDDKDYKIAFSENYVYENDDTNYEHEMKEYTFKGKDLNDGKAIIKLDKKITNDITSADFYVMYQMDGGFGQGGFRVNFVNSKDLLPNIKQYLIDNASDLIKNITKNTSVDDFADNIDVANNGKIKIYDTTGTTEITGNVGTGMIARVIDENDNNLLDLDVVVKGDVSGDGNISITDLVKVKRHLSEDEELTGVYEVAGNITDTGEIGITDLVKISRDVAKIQEVQ